MNPHNHLGHSAATQAFEAHSSLNALAIASSSSSLQPLSSTDTMNTLMAQQQQQQQHHNLGHLPLQQHHHQQHTGPAPVAAAAPKLASWKPPTTTATNPISTLVLGNQPPGGPLKVESSDANGPGRPAATMPNLTATTPASVAQSSLNALSSNLSASTQQPARPLSGLPLASNVAPRPTTTPLAPRPIVHPKTIAQMGMHGQAAGMSGLQITVQNRTVGPGGGGGGGGPATLSVSNATPVGSAGGPSVVHQQQQSHGVPTSTTSTASSAVSPVKPDPAEAAAAQQHNDNEESRKRKREQEELELAQAPMRKKLKGVTMSDFGLTLLPDFLTPFEDLDDAVNRLLPFHIYQDLDTFETAYAIMTAAEKAEPEPAPAAAPATTAPATNAVIAPAPIASSSTNTDASSSTAAANPTAATPAPAAATTPSNKLPLSPAARTIMDRAWVPPLGRSGTKRSGSSSSSLSSITSSKSVPADADLMDLDVESDDEMSFAEKIEADAQRLLDRAEKAMSVIAPRITALHDMSPFGLVPREEAFLMQRLLYSEEHAELTEEKTAFEKTRKEELQKEQQANQVQQVQQHRQQLHAQLLAQQRQQQQQHQAPPPGISPVQVKLAELVKTEMVKRRNNANEMKVLNSLAILASKQNLPQDQLGIVQHVVTNANILQTLFQQSAQAAAAAKPAPKTS